MTSSASDFGVRGRNGHLGRGECRRRETLLQSIGGKRMEGGPLLRMRRLWWRLGTAGWELEEDADTGPVEDC